MLLCWGAGLHPRSATPGPPDFSVFAYDLQLRLDIDQKRIAGRETISLRGTGDGLTTVDLPLNGIHVLSVTLGHDQALPTVTTNDHLQIRLPAPLARGQTVLLVVQYSANQPKGVEFQTDAVYTSFHTCHWMVCRDRPDDKATFALAIEVPAGLTLIASGARVKGSKREGMPGREVQRWQVWKETVPSSPYLFGFALGRFARSAHRHRGVDLEYFAAPENEGELGRMFADDDRMLDFFVGKAGLPLPRSFYRQVVVEGGAAQELTSFSILGRSHLTFRLADPTEDWLVAHELAHQFWGDLITCADWSHFWLNEGLTVFMVAAYKEYRWGRQAYEHELGLLRARHQSAIDARFDVPLTFAGGYPSLRLKRAITYSKGALFLVRLREVMGEAAFWDALKSYSRRFSGRAATTQDFQQVFAAQTGEDLRPLFDEWAYGMPQTPTATAPTLRNCDVAMRWTR
jgi:aminopeptidase N